MSSYEEKKQRRIDYYNAKAEKFEQESDRLSRESSRMIQAIPMGQPLLIDHYSYQSDKNYRDRAWNKMGKSVEAAQKADYYRRKAEAAENNTAVSSDDPEAIQKLERKLADLIQHQEFMKAVNAYYRKNKTLKGCPCISPETASKITSSMKNSWRNEPKHFESYELSNNNAEIRRLKERIETLKKQKETTFTGWKFEGGEVVLNKELNRLQIIFEDKPDEELRGELKSHGFRWAPSQQAWQRQFTNNALYAIKRIKAVQPKGDGSGNE